MQKLEAVFARGVTEIILDSLTQWDKDILLHISDEELPETFEIHIGYEGIKEAERFPVQKIDGIATVKIPNKVLQQTKNIKAWTYVIDSEGCRTTKTILIPIEKREKPVDYTSEIEPSQKDAIEQLVERTSKLIESSEALQEQAEILNKYITAEGTVVSPNADFAEVAEWADGNPNNEDRIGYFVCFDVPTSGIIMRKANADDDVKGITVSNPSFAGNCTKDKFDETGKLLPQYEYVGVIGLVPVHDNGQCIVGERCIPADGGLAAPSPNDKGYQVVERYNENMILIAVEPNGDMVYRLQVQIDELKENPPQEATEISYKFNIAELSKITVPNLKEKVLKFETIQEETSIELVYTLHTALKNVATGEITKLIDIPAQYDNFNEILNNNFNNFWDYDAPFIYNESVFGGMSIPFSVLGEELLEAGYCLEQKTSVNSWSASAAGGEHKALALRFGIKLTFASKAIKDAIYSQFIEPIFATVTHVGITYKKPAPIVDAPILIEQTSLEDTLYNFYGVDKEEYPYVFIVLGKRTTSVKFAKSYKTDGIRVWYYNALYKAISGKPTVTDNETVVNFVTTNIASVEATADGWDCATTDDTVYSNVDCTNCNATYIPLVE